MDAAGNRTAKQDDLAGVTSNYTYDRIYELTQVTQGTNTTESYSYDPVGNRLSSLNTASYSYNSSNELTSNSNGSYTYDNNGNTLSETNSTGTTSYAWDFENRLSQVTLPNSGGTVSFLYDPFGRRIEKISPTTTSIFVYDGDNLVETANASGGEVAKYAQGQSIDEPLAMDRSGTIDYYEQDGLGSVTSLTASNGSVAQSYTYDSFGNQTASSGSLTNFFRYTGREFDTETNLYYYRARYYDPTIGRFASEDPFGFLIDVNFYRYTMNRPVNLIDPLGLCWIYQQSTGKIYYNPDLSSPSGPSVFPDDLLSEYSIYGPNAVYIGQGYSGFGEGLNNPAMADYPDLGPIPIGFYTIGPQQLNITSNGIRLPGSMRLTPSPNNQMFNRNGFLIHGANQYATPTESSGCPVVRPAIRNKIGKSKDPCLVVVP